MPLTPPFGLHRPGGSGPVRSDRSGLPRVRAAVVVLAGGSGTRLGGAVNKVYLPLAGRRVISWSFTWAARVPEVRHYVLVVRPEDADLARQTLRRECTRLPVALVVGGDSRHDSEQAALDHLAGRVGSGEIDVIAIHDGARPLAGVGLFASVIRTAAAVGGAVPALPAGDVLPDPDAADPDTAGPGGHALVRVQTPQAFQARHLLAAYDAARAAGYRGTDTACSVEVHGDLAVQAVPGHRHNLKVTYPHDLFLAERLLAAHHYRMP